MAIVSHDTKKTSNVSPAFAMQGVYAGQTHPNNLNH